jgi:hypothetical protein
MRNVTFRHTHLAFLGRCSIESLYKQSLIVENVNAYRFRLLLVELSTFIFIENQQTHQNYHFIVMLSQTLLHVSAYQRHHQGTHMILTSYLYVGVHYRNNNRISCEVAPIFIVTQWIKVVVVNRCWKQ